MVFTILQVCLTITSHIIKLLMMLPSDACLCPGMQKMVAGTDRGRLMLFDAQRTGQVVNSALPVNEVVETKMIVKVAHEVFLVFFY